MHAHRRAYKTGELPLVMDNYAAHKRLEVRDWLAGNPRVPDFYHLVHTVGLGDEGECLAEVVG